MYRFIIANCFFILIISVFNCENKEISKKEIDFPKMQSVLNTVWQEIKIPIDGQSLLVDENNLFIIGFDNFAKVNINTLQAKKVNLPDRIDEYLTKDGGLTFIGKKDSNIDKKNICAAEKAVVMNNNLYSIGNCEHTAQFWNFSFTNGQSYILDFTYSTYPNSNTEDVVYFPRDIQRVGNMILLATDLSQGPAIQFIDSKSPKLRTRWQGKKEDGNLISMRFVGNNGWIITSKNNLLHSSDEGSTWQLLPNISINTEDNISEIYFRDNLEGFIIGAKGTILHTLNGGHSWDEQNSSINTSFKKMSLNDKIAVILDWNGKMRIYQKAENKWRNFDFIENETIDDILVLENWVFIISTGKLYRSEI